MDNLEEMDKFLEMYNLPKTEPGRNRKYEPTNTSNKIESVIKKKEKKNSQQTKIQDQTVSQLNSINI